MNPGKANPIQNSAPPHAPILLSRAEMALAYVAASYGFGLSFMVAFLMPLRVHELGAPIEMIGLIVGAAAAVPALFAVPAGELSDRLGARTTYVISATISGIALLLAATTSSYWILFAIQLVNGFARATAWLAVQAYLTSVGRPEDRAKIAGRMSFSTNAGIIAGPLIAGTASELFGFQYAFIVVGVLSLLYSLIGMRLPEVRVPRTTEKRGKSGGFGLALKLLRLKGIQVVMLLTFARLWSSTFWSAFYPLLLVAKNFTPTQAGAALSVYAVVSTVTTLWADWFSRRMGNAGASAFSLAVGALGVGLSPILLDYPLLFLPAIFLGFAQGLSLPLLVATVSEEAPPDQRGIAFGLRMSVNQAAGAVSPAIAGMIAASFGLGPSFFFIAVLTWVFLLAGMWLYRVGRRDPTKLTF